MTDIDADRPAESTKTTVDHIESDGTRDSSTADAGTGDTETGGTDTGDGDATDPETRNADAPGSDTGNTDSDGADDGTSRSVEALNKLRKSVTNSRLGDAGAALSRAESRATEIARQSRLASIAGTWKHYVEQSYCYRWLTAEPDPDVIVIDLRETWTVGPVIRLLDWVIERLEVALESSGIAARGRQLGAAVRDQPIRLASLVLLPLVLLSLLVSVVLESAVSELLIALHIVGAGIAAVGTRARHSLDEVLETRVGRWLVAAFEPPEPPAQRDEPADSATEERTDDS
ncbi:uncharacterized protein Nmag_0169 [Natrialba magadii ATCC 43099]|uniref:Uncharacterized protein n=1 Tax=Natrialba magadii (strain ATCC 43099 / DSM 3394 / CCM 3739 / CIP 104546 / IAM 13178 / JCM 8861 / NBRC 102185 / NCIMB 2190 / MS3) TaxID=547559 RepID=D3SWG9_NATMM|nr:hypothetical protein [Natrialba magadii]ADD03761.1 uncharacterized protein Nmag_0169 [Natrialba magadii ATCC 43099]ELY33816.1 hypothetical protein C500_01283 [Natrialba magadii ATCC 43099]